MSFLKKLRDYFFYCGIDGKEYKAIKKEAYVSNFVIWRSLHFLIAATFIALYVIALLSNVVRQNAIIYLVGAGYSVLVIILFFICEDYFAKPTLLNFPTSGIRAFGSYSIGIIKCCKDGG